VIQASDGNLYGMTAFGGVSGVGVIFSYNLTSNTYTKLHDCDFIDGGIPYAEFIEYNATTGINVTSDASGVIIYPNPYDGNLTIELPEKHPQEFTLLIFNTLGEKLEEFRLTQPRQYLNLIILRVYTLFL
ncbi:MAG: hypothetical protein H0V61_09715, partial [Chitinophagales bacterium]|nr:hypothetical protein [Chitinophagales bacterium]